MKRSQRSAARFAWAREIVVAGFALFALLGAQLLLTNAIHGSNYYGFDGKMAQSTILAAYEFARVGEINTIQPLQGIGSQMLPMNVWANPAYWPFAFVDKELATDISAVIALGIFAVACYIMMRCFGVGVVPSAIAAQLCILLFAPIVLTALAPTVFCLTPGNAVVYAPHLIALGLLGRLEPGSWRIFALTAGAIFALVFYSIYCDPLWTTINGISFALPFALVTVIPLRVKTTLIRLGALGACFALLLLTRSLEYVYTLSRYTARVQLSEVVDRPRVPEMVSALSFSPYMKYYYAAFAVGWVLGLLTLRGRPLQFVAIASLTFAAFLLYCLIYALLLDSPWVAPIPFYLEHSLFALFLATAVAGYWGALTRIYTWWTVWAAEGLPRMNPLRFHQAAQAMLTRIRILAIRGGVPRLAHVLAPLSRPSEAVSSACDVAAAQQTSAPRPHRARISTPQA